MCGLLHTPLELCGGPYDYCEWETIDSLDMVRSLSAILDAAVALDILVCLRYCAMAVRALHCGQLSLLQPISVLWLSSEDFIAGQNEARRELMQTRQHRKLITLTSMSLCFRGISFRNFMCFCSCIEHCKLSGKCATYDDVHSPESF